MPRMCLAVVAVAGMSVVGGGARWQQEVAVSATLRQEVAAMVAFLQRAVRHRQDIICCRIDQNSRHTAASGGRGVGGEGHGGRDAICGCGGRKCIGSKSKEKIRVPSIVERGQRQKQTNKKVKL